MNRILLSVVALLISTFAVPVFGQSPKTSSQAPATSPSTARASSPTTSMDGCGTSSSCDTCVASTNAKCVWCDDQKKCHVALSHGLFDLGSVCPGGLWKASWATCSVNMMALIIGMGVVGGVLLISIFACICCCCCKNSARQKLKWMRDDAASKRSSDERKEMYAQRRAERQAKNDEMRRKYGLSKDGETGYQRFDDA